MKPSRIVILVFLASSAFFIWGADKAKVELEQPPQSEVLEIPLGLPPIPWPDNNPYSRKKAELGRLLYFDKRLSSNGTISCATCHSIPRAFTDQKRVSSGIMGHQGTRHAPTVINAAYQKRLFWDGRASSLEEQVLGPTGNPKEMTLAKDVHEAHKECHERVHKIAGYRPLFKEVFGTDECSMDEISKAIATFERTILSGNSPYDRYMAGDKTAMSAEQIEGYKIFLKSGCANCHLGPILTDGRFLNIGVNINVPDPDLGRYLITKRDIDWGGFKIPTLREVEHTYPYMHDGSIATLEEVVDYYDKGCTANKNLNPLIHPLHLSDQEKKALVKFMHALSGEGWQHFTEPAKYPD